MKKTYILLTALVAALVVGAAPPAFEKVPNAARIALKGARGKQVRKGMVFVNGHYLPPPYVVTRYGTAIFINNVQVTGQIVPWKQFLATQPGYKPPPVATPAPTPAPAPRPAPIAPKRATSIDDLFDDDVPAPAPAPAPAPVVAAPAPVPVAAPEEDVGGDDITFEPNARSNMLLKRINDYRTEINKRLLNGDACFFGRYGFVAVQQRVSRDMMNVLPEAMRDSENGAELFSRMTARGFSYLNANICADLMENRADYAALLERRRKMRADEEVLKIISGTQEIVP